MTPEEIRCQVVVADSSERIGRVVLSPRDVDLETGYPKENFITLRLDEDGISFLRIDYLGEEVFLQKCKEREQLYNRKKKKQSFVGWMEAKVGEIVSIDPERIFPDIPEPVKAPEHLLIKFRTDGEAVRGIVTDALVLDLMDEIFHCLKYEQALQEDGVMT